MYFIYKIQFKDYIYIGSTKDMTRRQYEHNYELRKGRKDWPVYNLARENGFNYIECVEIEQVEDHERYTTEQYYIDEFSNTYSSLNIRNTVWDVKQYNKDYWMKNKEHLQELNKKWRKNNKEYVKEANRKWRENRKKLIHQQHLLDLQAQGLQVGQSPSSSASQCP
jgi:hypothetical protein